MGKHKAKDKRRNRQNGAGGDAVPTRGEEDLPKDPTVADAWGPCPVCGEWLALHDSGAEDDLSTCIEVLKANLAAARAFPAPAPYLPLPYYPQNPWYPPAPVPPYHPNTTIPNPLPQTIC